jgi:hypothetical protein
MDSARVLVVFSLLQIATALTSGIPMPVQPLKAVAAIVIAERLSGDIVAGAGMAIRLSPIRLLGEANAITTHLAVAILVGLMWVGLPYGCLVGMIAGTLLVWVTGAACTRCVEKDRILAARQRVRALRSSDGVLLRSMFYGWHGSSPAVSRESFRCRLARSAPPSARSALRVHAGRAASSVIYGWRRPRVVSVLIFRSYVSIFP